MPINPNIPLSVKSLELANPLDAYAKVAGIQNAQNQNALAQYQIESARRSDAQQNALNSAYQSAFNPQTGEVDQNALLANVAKSGFGAQIPGIQKTLLEAQKAKVERAKAITDLYKNTATSIMTNPQSAEAAIMEFGKQTGSDVTQYLKEVQSLGGDPNKIRAWAAGHAVQADKLMPQFQQTDLGNVVVQGMRDPLTGQLVTEPSILPKGMTPGEAARTRNEVAPTMTEVVDPTNPKQMLRVNARVYQGGGLGSPGVLGISGKEPTAAAKEVQSQEGRQAVDMQIATLRDFYDQLNKSGGITSTSNRGLTNLGAGIASSGVGQAAGRLVGTQNQSMRNSIAQQRPLLLQAIKQATGMSSKQMDSNAELKMYLSAATDPTLDYESNIRALDNLSRLFGLGGGVAKQAPAATSGPHVGMIQGGYRFKGGDPGDPKNWEKQ